MKGKRMICIVAGVLLFFAIAPFVLFAVRRAYIRRMEAIWLKEAGDALRERGWSRESPAPGVEIWTPPESDE